MGYTTDFCNGFKLNKKLDKETHEFLTKFSETRRMARDAAKLKAQYGKDFGVEGEFFVDGDGYAGQGDGGYVLDHNGPPRTQPGLWCQWIPNEDGTEIVWDEGEKFYNYVEWLEYLIEKILKPRGYELTGDVKWFGEDRSDIGVISVKKNVVRVYQGVTEPPKVSKIKLSKSETPVEIHSIVHPDNGKKYAKLSDLTKAFKQAKKLGADIDFVIAELARISKR